MLNRRFAPPWSIEDIGTAYFAKDGGGQKLAYIHYEDAGDSEMRRINSEIPCG